MNHDEQAHLLYQRARREGRPLIVRLRPPALSTDPGLMIYIAMAETALDADGVVIKTREGRGGERADAETIKAAILVPVLPEHALPSRMELRRELAELLNRHSVEDASDTADFILADYLLRALDAYEAAVAHRDRLQGPA